MNNNGTNAEAAELGTTQNGAVNQHKTRRTSVRSVEPQRFPPGITDPRTMK